MAERTLRLRHLLRESTGEVHEALHRLPCFARLADATIGRAEYARLLQRMEEFYAAADPALGAAARRFEAATGGEVHHPRAPLLARDLAALDLTPKWRRASAFPSPDSPAALAGALYVVDGSLLGGAVLGRAVAQLDWPAPASYWRWAGAEGPAIWWRTVALLGRVDDGEASRRAAAASAEATFRAFAACMKAPAAVPAQV